MNSLVQTPTNKLENSLAFYSKLNFKTISESPNIVSDGRVYIEINPSPFARAGLKLYRPDWTQVVSQLKERTAVVTIENGFLLGDNNGVWIYLLEEDAPTILLDQKSNTILGNAAGLSIESINIEESIKIWEILGFRKTMGGIEQGWISFENEDKLPLSIMKANVCPHLFYNPSLSYFNGEKNEEIIDNIRSLEIPITEEITQFNTEGKVDNIIIRDPGGLGFFIFND